MRPTEREKESGKCRSDFIIEPEIVGLRLVFPNNTGFLRAVVVCKEAKCDRTCSALAGCDLVSMLANKGGRQGVTFDPCLVPCQTIPPVGSNYCTERPLF